MYIIEILKSSDGKTQTEVDVITSIRKNSSSTLTEDMAKL